SHGAAPHSRRPRLSRRRSGAARDPAGQDSVGARPRARHVAGAADRARAGPVRGAGGPPSAPRLLRDAAHRAVAQGAGRAPRAPSPPTRTPTARRRLSLILGAYEARDLARAAASAGASGSVRRRTPQASKIA